MKFTHFIPFLIFAVLTGAFAALLLNPRGMTLLEKPAPDFSIQNLSKADIDDGIVLVNFFASWCTPCRAEHPLLMNLDIPVYGIAYKDQTKDLDQYLKDLGNPYAKVGADFKGTVFIDWGLAGVPESFILKDGIIRYRFSGALMEHDISDKIIPIVQALRAE